MIINGNLSNASLELVSQAINDHDCSVKASVGSSHLVGTETVKVHSEGWGDWHLFGGYCMHWALIQASSWEEAYEIYLEHFVTPDEMPETEEELECGTWGDNGNWYSECTTSYIVHLDVSNYDQWDIEITPRN
jgi:hypothetical protein